MSEDLPLSPADLPSQDRRRFLVVAGTGLGACGVALLPFVSSLVAPVGRRTVRFASDPFDVGAISDFHVDEPRRVAIRGRITDGWQADERDLGAAWITRHSDGRWTAFSSICPHLGCAIDYTGKKELPFLCPCHESTFSLDGAAEKGPSPRGLDALPIKIEGERVLVEFHRYVLNQKHQVES